MLNPAKRTALSYIESAVCCFLNDNIKHLTQRTQRNERKDRKEVQNRGCCRGASQCAPDYLKLLMDQDEIQILITEIVVLFSKWICKITMS